MYLRQDGMWSSRPSAVHRVTDRSRLRDDSSPDSTIPVCRIPAPRRFQPAFSAGLFRSRYRGILPGHTDLRDRFPLLPEMWRSYGRRGQSRLLFRQRRQIILPLSAFIRTFDKSEPFLIFGLNTGFYERKGSDFIFAMIIIDQVKKGGKHNGQ